MAFDLIDSNSVKRAWSSSAHPCGGVVDLVPLHTFFRYGGVHHASPWVRHAGGVASCENIHNGAMGGAPLNGWPSYIGGGGSCKVPPLWSGTSLGDQLCMSMARSRSFKKQRIELPLHDMPNVGVLESPTSKMESCVESWRMGCYKHKDLYQFGPLEHNTLHPVWEYDVFIDSWVFKYGACNRGKYKLGLLRASHACPSSCGLGHLL
jgi:hypothetical protein